MNKWRNTKWVALIIVLIVIGLFERDRLIGNHPIFFLGILIPVIFFSLEIMYSVKPLLKHTFIFGGLSWISLLFSYGSFFPVWALAGYLAAVLYIIAVIVFYKISESKKNVSHGYL